MRETGAPEEGTETSTPAPAGTVRRRARLGWWLLICVVAAISFFAWLQLSRSGGSASGLASAYGFTIGDFRAPTFKEWGFQSEPWLFVMDRTGTIVKRFEGPLTATEVLAVLRPLVA